VVDWLTVASSAGSFWIGPTWALYVGPGLRATVHEHHATQLVIPLGGRVRLRSPGEVWGVYDGAVVSADVPHESDRAVPLIGTIWSEPGPRRDQRPPASAIAAVPAARSTALRHRFLALAEAPAASASALVHELVKIANEGPARVLPADGRVLAALELLEPSPGHQVRLASVASEVDLSPSRLAHLFVAEVGIPFRRYVLWRRLRAAVAEMATGASATTAAHDAGFADSAHLSRTFRRMIGFTPSSGFAVADSRFVQA